MVYSLGVSVDHCCATIAAQKCGLASGDYTTDSPFQFHYVTVVRSEGLLPHLLYWQLQIISYTSLHRDDMSQRVHRDSQYLGLRAPNPRCAAPVPPFVDARTTILARCCVCGCIHRSDISLYDGRHMLIHDALSSSGGTLAEVCQISHPDAANDWQGSVPSGCCIACSQGST